jgi:hypothetical protein
MVQENNGAMVQENTTKQKMLDRERHGGRWIGFSPDFASFALFDPKHHS